MSTEISHVITFYQTMSEEETRYFTAAEVAAHSTESDLWVILDSKVYDVTEFASKHPGGAKAIINLAGTDITDRFGAIESHVNAFAGIQKTLPTMYVGELRE